MRLLSNYYFWDDSIKKYWNCLVVQEFQAVWLILFSGVVFLFVCFCLVVVVVLVLAARRSGIEGREREPILQKYPGDINTNISNIPGVLIGLLSLQIIE